MQVSLDELNEMLSNPESQVMFSGAPGDDLLSKAVPVLNFVLTANDVLDGNQQVKLMGLLMKKRHEIQILRERHIGRFTKAWFKKLAEELNLTEQQKSQIKQLGEQHRAEQKALAEKLRDGTIDKETFKDESLKLWEEFEKNVKAVLTSEQQAKSQQLRDERKGKFVDFIVKNINRFSDARLKFLTKQLNLTESKVATLKPAFDAHASAVANNLTQFKSNQIDRKQLVANLKEEEKKLEEKIASVLTPAQQMKWNFIRNLFKHRGGLR
jgi:Spy/CpxP family protein refolding chaperone